MTQQFPEIKDYARLAPPWASVVVGREPVVKWHTTRGGAWRSAETGSTKGVDGSWYIRQASRPFGVARVDSCGDLVVVEQYAPGERVRP